MLQSKGHSLGLSVTCLQDKENLELTFQSSCGNCKYRLGYWIHHCQLYFTGLGTNQCWQVRWFKCGVQVIVTQTQVRILLCKLAQELDPGIRTEVFLTGFSTKFGCSSLVPVQWTSEFIVSPLGHVHYDDQWIHSKSKFSEITWRPVKRTSQQSLLSTCFIWHAWLLTSVGRFSLLEKK
jgi:hypothetical protein